MNDGTLSQQEIDALLTGAGEAYDKDSDDFLMSTSGSSVNTGDLSNLLEVLNLVLQVQTEHLSNIIERDFTFSNVKGRIKDNDQVSSELDGKLIQIKMDFTTGVLGENLYILKLDDALRLVEIISKQRNVELSEVSLSVLSEAFIRMMSISNNALSQKLGRMISVDPPQIEILDDSSQIRFPDESQVVHLSYTLNPEDSLSINMNQIMSISLAKEIIGLVKGVIREQGAFSDDQVSEFDIGDDIRISTGTVSSLIRPIKYQELAEINLDSIAKSNIGLLLDISMQLTVELGRTKMQIKKILGLGEGSIIELEKLAGEPVDLLVNGKLIAKGEVVVIDENFGVRITEIVSPHERLESISLY